MNRNGNNGNYGDQSSSYRAGYSSGYGTGQRQNTRYGGGNGGGTYVNGYGNESGHGQRYNYGGNENGYGIERDRDAGNRYPDRRTEQGPHQQTNGGGGIVMDNGSGGGIGGDGRTQPNYGEVRNSNMENWTQCETDRPAEQPAGTSNGTVGRPRLGSKRGRDGGGTPDAETRQEDGPPRTRQRQLQL
jgi:hypothetical protein